MFVDVNDTDTWTRYRNGLCGDCHARCCTMPVEVRVADLVRMGVVDAFEADEEPRLLARRLLKQGIVEHFNHKYGLYTLPRRANGDCSYLGRDDRRCTIYERRPDTCRNHPRVGPRPGYCAYGKKAQPR